MGLFIRRIKGGKTHFAASVDSATGVVNKWVDEKKSASSFDEPTAKKAFERIGGKVNTGTTIVETEGGKEVAKCIGIESVKSEIIEKLSSVKGELVTLPDGYTQNHGSLVADAGPFAELHSLLGMTTDPRKTTLTDVAAAALQEIKDLRELMDSDPEATKLTSNSTPPAGGDAK